MIDFTALKNFDLTQLDPTKIDLTKFDVRNLDMPKFDMPAIDKADLDKIADFARDAAYVGIGAAVVAVKKADEQRRELAEQVSARVRKLVDAVA